jgi:nucleoside-diphosphate kinase
MIPFMQRTLVLIKPDAVLRGLVGEIISRFERAGLTIVAIKLVRPTAEQAKGHYPTTDAQLTQMGRKTLAAYTELKIDPIEVLGTADAKEIGLMIHDWNAEFLASGPVIACIVKGVQAIKKVRAICGSTMPKDALPGTIRGDFSSVSAAIANVQKTAVYNLVHASDNENDPDEPEKEIAYWFSPEEIIEYILIDDHCMFKWEDEE